MITVCCRFAHYFKIMPRRQPVCFEASPPHTVQRLRYGRGEEGDVWFTCSIEGQDPEIYELWNFSDDGISKVQPYAQVQISDDFIGETFYTHFFNAREVRIFFLGRRSVNRSVQCIDVPRLFGKTRVATAAWNENIYVNPWSSMNSPDRTPDVSPINLRAVARCIRDDIL